MVQRWCSEYTECELLFENRRLDVLLGELLTERGERYRFVVTDAEFEPHVDCGVHGVPLGVVTRGDPAFAGVSCYSTLDGFETRPDFELSAIPAILAVEQSLRECRQAPAFATTLRSIDRCEPCFPSSVVTLFVTVILGANSYWRSKRPSYYAPLNASLLGSPGSHSAESHALLSVLVRKSCR